MAATTAYAGPPANVTVGGATTGSHAISGHTTGAISFNAGGVAMSCTSGTATGSVTAGSYTPYPTPNVATITGTTWSGCVGPLGIPMNVAHSGTWGLQITGNESGTVTPGRLVNISATVTSATPGLCSFKVAGTVNGSFNDATSTGAHTHNGQLLSVVTAGSTLTVSNVVGCFNLIPNGASANFAGTYHVTKTDNNTEWPIKITT
ncbi:hypothetical protein [Mumia quercus]|uniref:hypothetical protein n=1 Tax=Mumia quercus TaxID=2976125 RepID=UPI0021CE1CDC|nr:hypothetical protein [Mumia quercus]